MKQKGLRLSSSFLPLGKKEFFFFTGLCVTLVAFGILLVQPWQNVPVGDDWAYNWSVQNWVETGYFRISNWAAPALVLMMWYGAVFVKLFGFSFVKLRITTWAISLIAPVAVYALMRGRGANIASSIVGALCLLVCPLYFLLTHSFMTDVPYLAFAVLALYGFISGLERRSVLHLLLGNISTVAVFLVRQFGVTISLFAVAYALWRWWHSRTKSDAIAILVTAVPLPCFAIFQFWYTRIHGTTVMYRYTQGGATRRLLVLLAATIVIGMVGYGGAKIRRRVGKSRFIQAGGLFLMILLLVVGGIFATGRGAMVQHLTIRLVQNPVLSSLVLRTLLSGAYVFLGLSPWVLTIFPWNSLITSLSSAELRPKLLLWMSFNMLLSGWFIFQDPLPRYVPLLPVAWSPLFLYLFAGLTFMGGVGLFLLFSQKIQPIPNAPQLPKKPFETVVSAAEVLCAGTAISAFVFNISSYLFFDRYLLVLFPVVLIWLAPQTRIASLKLVAGGIGLLFLFFLVGAAQTSNGLRQQEAMWQSARSLLNQGVPLTQVDADQTWDGWHLYHWAELHPDAQRPTDVRCDGWFISGYLPVINRQYNVGDVRLPDYKVISSRNWQAWGTGQSFPIYTQHRERDACIQTRKINPTIH